MLTPEDSLTLRLRSLPDDIVRAAVRRWSISAVKKRRTISEAMEADGWAVVEVPDDAVMADGRIVRRVGGKAFVMRADVHAERLAEALEKAKQKAVEIAQTAEVKEALSETTCPQMIDGKPCGGSLNRKGVCPSCVTGKMGYRYRYTCESCGCDIVTKEELR